MSSNISHVLWAHRCRSCSSLSQQQQGPFPLAYKAEGPQLDLAPVALPLPQLAPSRQQPNQHLTHTSHLPLQLQLQPTARLCLRILDLQQQLCLPHPSQPPSCRRAPPLLPPLPQLLPLLLQPPQQRPWRRSARSRAVAAAAAARAGPAPRPRCPPQVPPARPLLRQVRHSRSQPSAWGLARQAAQPALLQARMPAPVLATARPLRLPHRRLVQQARLLSTAGDPAPPDAAPPLGRPVLLPCLRSILVRALVLQVPIHPLAPRSQLARQ